MLYLVLLLSHFISKTLEIEHTTYCGECISHLDEGGYCAKISSQYLFWKVKTQDKWFKNWSPKIFWV